MRYVRFCWILLAKYAYPVLQIWPKFGLTLQEVRIYNVSMSTRLKKIVLPNLVLSGTWKRISLKQLKINLRENYLRV